MSLNKVVLHVWSDGTCSLITVPLSWRPGDELPADAAEERYETPALAMRALAEAGRAQNPTQRIRWIETPPEATSPAETSEDQSSS